MEFNFSKILNYEKLDNYYSNGTILEGYRMPCPHCGKETPGDSFCSVECMNAYEEERVSDTDEEELERRYALLKQLTRDYSECPFCRLKLVLSKALRIDEEDEDDLNTLERQKICPKCYRVYGFLIKDDISADWEFDPVYFEEAYDLLVDLGKIIKREKSIF